MILGQRQIGKTYIVREFAKNEFQKLIELNFLTNESHHLFFQKLNGFDNLLNHLVNYFNLDINKLQNYLFFFDEIQECPKAISALKMINEADLKINLICSGSYLTYQIASTNFNFPVGQVQNLQMKQMMFDEFIIALGKENLLNLAIESIKVKKEIAPLIHQELLK